MVHDNSKAHGQPTFIARSSFCLVGGACFFRAAFSRSTGGATVLFFVFGCCDIGVHADSQVMSLFNDENGYAAYLSLYMMEPQQSIVDLRAYKICNQVLEVPTFPSSRRGDGRKIC